MCKNLGCRNKKLSLLLSSLSAPANFTLNQGVRVLNVRRHLGQNLRPIWPAGICASLQPGHHILLLLLMHQVEGQLEGDSFHISALESRRDVHVHLEKPPELPAFVLLLLRLQLGEQVDKPLKALLVSIDPDEVNFFEVEHASLDQVRPAVVTAGACMLDIEIPV